MFVLSPGASIAYSQKKQTLESRLVSQNLKKMQVNLSWEAVIPRKINMEPDKTPPGRGKIIFQTIIFRFYVNLRGCIFSLCSVQILEDWEIHWRFWNPNGRLSEDHPAMLVSRSAATTYMTAMWNLPTSISNPCDLLVNREHGDVKPHRCIYIYIYDIYIYIIFLKLAVRWWISSINSAYSTFST